MKGVLIIVALLVTGSAHAAYKCTIDGEVVFSQTPCADNAEELQLKYHQPSAADVQSANARTEQWQAKEEQQRIRGEIAKLEKEIATNQQLMDKELELLRIKQSTTNNNLAGATYRQAIATEMQAVTEKYKTKNALAQEKIAQLNEQLSKLEK